MEAFTRELANDEVVVEASDLPAPLLTYVSSTKRWRIEADYAYLDGATTITVPMGFGFDLSSVPRPLWWLIAPFDLSISAPLIHDFLYSTGGAPDVGIQPPTAHTRRDVDLLFRTIMGKEHVAGWRRALGYAAVRLFGSFAWRADGRSRAATGSRYGGGNTDPGIDAGGSSGGNTDPGT
jgi:hypothetical protein